MHTQLFSQTVSNKASLDIYTSAGCRFTQNICDKIKLTVAWSLLTFSPCLPTHLTIVVTLSVPTLFSSTGQYNLAVLLYSTH